MTLNDLKERLVEQDFEDSVLLYCPDYASAVIGVSQNGQVIYDYNKMIEFLVREENMTEEEAIEFIDYNTVRSLPYMGEKAPIILYDILD